MITKTVVKGLIYKDFYRVSRSSAYIKYLYKLLSCSVGTYADVCVWSSPQNRYFFVLEAESICYAKGMDEVASNGSERLPPGDNSGQSELAGLAQELDRRPPSHETQVDRLLGMQMGHTQRLQELGLMERALKRLGITQAMPNTQVAVAVHSHLQDSGDSVEVVVHSVYDYGAKQRRTRYAEVADSYAGVTMPRAGFESKDAVLIGQLATELRTTKADGILPRLSLDLTEIR